MTDSCIDNSRIIFSESYSSPNGFSGVAHYDGTAKSKAFICFLAYLVGWLVGWVGLDFDYGSAAVDQLRAVYMLDKWPTLELHHQPSPKAFHIMTKLQAALC